MNNFIFFPFTSFAHSGFVRQSQKMFGRAVRNIIRKELLGSPQKKSHKILTRAILTSESSFLKHNLADTENDIIVYSPLPSINYPDCTIEQYVWNDFNKWSNKTALVREKTAENKYSQRDLTT
jgi:hypothetical protein